MGDGWGRSEGGLSFSRLSFLTTKAPVYLTHFVPSHLTTSWRPLALANLILICAASHYIFSFICSTSSSSRRGVTIKAEAEHNNWLLLQFQGRQRPFLIPNSKKLLRTSKIWAAFHCTTVYSIHSIHIHVNNIFTIFSKHFYKIYHNIFVTFTTTLTTILTNTFS